MPTETPATVLLIDDDDAIRALLSRELDADGYAPLGAATLTDARRHLQESFPDIAILDTGLPDGSGLTLLGEIRDRHGQAGGADPDLPVLVLSGSCAESDRVRAFERGADDFLAKPFSYRELRGRVAAVLRRREGHVRRGALQVAGLRIDPLRREVRYGDERLRLTQKEFSLLHQLAGEPMRVFTKDELLRTIWGFRAPGATTTRTLDSHACRLRGKLAGAGAPHLVENVWGVGYRLSAEDPEPVA